MIDLIRRRYPEDLGEMRPEKNLENGAPPIRKVSLGSPLRWLRQGWQDLFLAPSALLHGLVVSVAGMALVWLSWSQPWLALALIVGFLLMGPALAVSLNALSRGLEKGRRTEPRGGLGAIAEIGAPLWMFAALLLALFAVWTAYTWLWIAVMNVGELGLPADIGELLDAMMASSTGMVSIAGVVIAGVAFAFVAFALSVITVPTMLDRKFGLVDSIAVSLKAFKRNWLPLLLWAVIITVLFMLSVLTAFIALIVIFPWLGLSMWHGYRSLVAPGDHPARANPHPAQG